MFEISWLVDLFSVTLVPWRIGDVPTHGISAGPPFLHWLLLQLDGDLYHKVHWGTTGDSCGRELTLHSSRYLEDAECVTQMCLASSYMFTTQYKFEILQSSMETYGLYTDPYRSLLINWDAYPINGQESNFATRALRWNTSKCPHGHDAAIDSWTAQPYALAQKVATVVKAHPLTCSNISNTYKPHLSCQTTVTITTIYCTHLSWPLNCIGPACFVCYTG